MGRRSEASSVGCEGVKGGELRRRQARSSTAAISISGDGKLGSCDCEGESKGKRESVSSQKI